MSRHQVVSIKKLITLVYTIIVCTVTLCSCAPSGTGSTANSAITAAQFAVAAREAGYQPKLLYKYENPYDTPDNLFGSGIGSFESEWCDGLEYAVGTSDMSIYEEKDVNFIFYEYKTEAQAKSAYKGVTTMNEVAVKLAKLFINVTSQSTQERGSEQYKIIERSGDTPSVMIMQRIKNTMLYIYVKEIKNPDPYLNQVLGLITEGRKVDAHLSIKQALNNAPTSVSVDSNVISDMPDDELLAEFALASYDQKKNNDLYNGWNVKTTDPENDRFSCTILSKGNSIVYAFRGTPLPDGFSNTLIDWGQTLKYYMLSDANTAAHAQSGALQNFIQSEIIPTLLYTDKNVYFTGHSLGGWLAIESYIKVSSSLNSDNLRKLKRVVTYNTIGISKEDMNHYETANTKNQWTNVVDYYICCDVARWFGYNSGFFFPGEHVVICEYHDEIGIKEGDYQSLYKHAYSDDLDKVLVGLLKASKLLSKSKIEAAWNWFYYSLYTKPTGIIPFDELIPYPPEVGHSVTILSVRMDAHGMSHFLDLRIRDTENNERSLRKNLYYAQPSNGLPYPD